MTIAVKCAPQEDILNYTEKAGLSAVELYTDVNYLKSIRLTKEICLRYPFWYAVHAPNNGYEPNLLAELVDGIKAEIVVFHNIYWEDEWLDIIKVFKDVPAKLCIENTYSALEPFKFMRRFGMGLCLDLEHLQMECNGVFEEAFIPCIQKASHIHLTGYFYGSNLWHTHIHHSPEHNIYLLNLLKNSDYSGFIVSEAKTSLQTLSEFKRLNEFIQTCKNGMFERKNYTFHNPGKVK